MTENRIGGLLLAAGGSTRFASPKQLAKFWEKTLLRTAAEAITASGCSPVVVVLGACVEKCRREVEHLPVTVAINPDWRSGMSSSIKTGLNRVLKLEPEVDAVLITLMDQPLVTATDLAEFVERFKRDRSPLVAAQYNDVAGVPALFSQNLFGELLKLEGDTGARALLRDRPDVVTIALPEAAADIDHTSDQLENHRK